MEFFDGLAFRHAGIYEDYALWREKRYEGYYAFQYVHRGRLRLSVGDHRETIVHAPAAWLCRPGPFIRFGNPDGETWTHFFVSFEGPRVERYLASGLLPADDRSPVVPVHAPQRFQLAFRELVTHVSQRRVYLPRSVHLLEGLLLQLHEPRGEEPAPFEVRAMDLARLMEDIRVRCEIDWDFREQAERLGLSYTHFRRSFRAYAGVPPHRFVIQTRLLKAASLLLRTDRPVTEIARSVGFNDLGYFARVFRRFHEISPAAFRAQGRR